MNSPGLAALCVTAVALALNAAVGLTLGMSHEPRAGSDEYYYLHLGQSLAGGRGFTTPGTFWPEQPTLQRMPAWPAAIAVGIRLLPWMEPAAVMRAAALFLNALSAGLLALLAARALTSLRAGVIAGLLYSVHPVGGSCAYEGLSEPLFMTLALSGTLLLLRGRWGCLCEEGGRGARVARSACFLGGMLLLGLAALDRPNFVLWGPAAWRSAAGRCSGEGVPAGGDAAKRMTQYGPRGRGPSQTPGNQNYSWSWEERRPRRPHALHGFCASRAWPCPGCWSSCCP